LLPLPEINRYILYK